MRPFQHVLVAVDFGASSKEALDAAIGIAKHYDAALTLLHTWEIPAYGYGAMEFSAVDMLVPIQNEAQKQLDALLAVVREQRPEAHGILAMGVAWQEILNTIERTKPDLVVMGTHGREGLKRMLLGSVAEKIVRLSPVSVLTVRGKS